MYLVSKWDLESLAMGIVKVEELAIPENEALITWSGADVKAILEKEGIKTDLREIVEKIKKLLERCDCGACIECAFDDVIRRNER